MTNNSIANLGVNLSAATMTNNSTANLGVNVWLPASAQWALFVLIIIGVVYWVWTLPNPQSNTQFNLTMKTFAVPLALLVTAFIMFFGLVSYIMKVNIVCDALTDILLVLVFLKTRTLIPYLSGAFAAIFFLIPVQAAVQKGLVVYDYNWYSMNVLWTTGASNAFTAIMMKKGWISPKTRWIAQSMGWPAIMSGLVLIPMLMGVNFEAYHLKLDETIRYSAFQVCVYIFIFYGFCGHTEHLLPKEGADSVSTPAIVCLGVALFLEFALGGMGKDWINITCFLILLASSIWVLSHKESSDGPDSPFIPFLT